MKKLLSIILVICMSASLFVGCVKSEDTSGGNEGASNDAQSGSNDSEIADDEEVAEIIVALATLAPMDSSQTDAIQEAINEMTLEKINTKVTLQWYDVASYATQVPMMIQANEKLDLLMFTPAPTASYASFRGQNQLMDIKDLLDEYAPAIVSELGSLLDATTTPDGVLGVTNNGPLANTVSITMRKDILEELGLVEKAENMSSWTDYEEILTEVVANTDLAGVINSDAEGSCITPVPFMTNADKFEDNYGYDQLGDGYHMIAVDQETDTVMPYFLSDGFYEMITRAKDWQDKGLIYKDAAIAQDYSTALLKNEVGFSQVSAIEVGVESSLQSIVGKELMFKGIAPSILATNSANKWGFSVPVTATEPEAAVKFLNLLHTDTDVINTLTWGIEGDDWISDEDGFATYPEGVTNETVSYHTGDFLYGNRFIIIPWEGSEVGIREAQKRVNEEATMSRYMGFTADISNITTELTACNNVKEQYKAALVTGIVSDLDAVYNEFIEKLKVAGIDKVVAEYQTQLDTWLEQQ